MSRGGGGRERGGRGEGQVPMDAAVFYITSSHSQYGEDPLQLDHQLPVLLVEVVAVELLHDVDAVTGDLNEAVKKIVKLICNTSHRKMNIKYT